MVFKHMFDCKNLFFVLFPIVFFFFFNNSVSRVKYSTLREEFNFADMAKNIFFAEFRGWQNFVIRNTSKISKFKEKNRKNRLFLTNIKF